MTLNHILKTIQKLETAGSMPSIIKMSLPTFYNIEDLDTLGINLRDENTIHTLFGLPLEIDNTIPSDYVYILETPIKII
jgi:hypothetical protein